MHLALADRQGVIKFGGVGEVAHAELIQPFQRTSLPCAADDQIYLELLRVHASILTSSPRRHRLLRRLAAGPITPAGDVCASKRMSGCATVHPTSGHLAFAGATPVL